MLFVEPPIDYPNPAPNTGVHLGLLSIISYLRENNIQADFRFLSEQIELATSESQSSLGECLSDWTPNVVCISAITAQFPRAVEIARAAKHCGAFVIMGNIYPSMNAVEIIKSFPFIDIVVHGEGESVLLEILNHMILGTEWRNSRGITFRSGDEITSTPQVSALDLSQLPAPAYDLLPLDLCKKLDLYGTVETARGCTFDCIFCTLIEHFGLGYRLKTIDQVVSECQIIKELGFRRVIITDDTFTLNRNRTMSLCQALKGAELDLHFYVLTRIDLLDQELLHSLMSTGVREILFGVEQIDEENLSSMKKARRVGNWAELAELTIRTVADLGCIAHPVFMLGWPGDTPEKLRRLVDFAVKIGSSPFVEPFVAFTTPHPGSRLWYQREALGLKVITSDLSKFMHLYPVAVPLSLGDNGIELLVEAHNTIRVETGMATRNPCIDLDFVLSYSDLL